MERWIRRNLGSVSRVRRKSYLTVNSHSKLLVSSSAIYSFALALASESSRLAMM
jgi:hypothetical protein